MPKTIVVIPISVVKAKGTCRVESSIKNTAAAIVAEKQGKNRSLLPINPSLASILEKNKNATANPATITTNRIIPGMESMWLNASLIVTPFQLGIHVV